MGTGKSRGQRPTQAQALKAGAASSTVLDFKINQLHFNLKNKVILKVKKKFLIKIKFPP